MNSKKDITAYENLYFIGIGGIGMSALARYFSENGKKVAGYDKVASKITRSLEELGVEIHYEEEKEKIPKIFLEKEKSLIVYTPAIPKNHKEYKYFKENRYTILKRAEVLGLITKNTVCLAVAGTHGKTTTATILGHILKEAGVNATSFLGGVSENYKSNLILGGDKISVVEADEYDRSFLQLSPNIACITSMDADHLDIYGKAEELEKTFHEFAGKVTDKLFVRYGLGLKGITFGFEAAAEYQAKNIRVEKGMSVFEIKTPTESIGDIRIQLPGKHNILNVLVAMAMANIFGVSLREMKKGLLSFKGIERRFNIKIKTEKLVLIDDYAHHPTEIEAVYQTIKDLYPKKRKIVVFQPHLYSRTRDFIEEFTKKLAQFDEVILLDIYPAREIPIQGVTSARLVEKIKQENSNVKLVELDSEAIINNIKKEDVVIAMLGAGDIGKIVDEVCAKLIELVK